MFFQIEIMLQRFLKPVQRLWGLVPAALVLGIVATPIPAAIAQTQQPYFERVLQEFEAERQTAQQQGDTEAEIQALYEAGQANQYFGDFRTAQRLMEQGLTLSRQAEDLDAEEKLLYALAILHHKQGDYGGLDFLNRQLERAQQQQDETRELLVLEELAGSHFVIDDMQGMFRIYREYFPRVQAKGDWQAQFNVYRQLAIAFSDLGNWEQAALAQANAFTTVAEQDNLRLVLPSMFELGELYEQQRNYKEAEQWYHNVFTLAQQTGQTYWMIRGLEAGGWVLGAQGDYTTAFDVLNQAKQLAQSQGENGFSIIDRISLLQGRQGLLRSALQSQAECAQLEQELGMTPLGSCGPQQLAWLQLQYGRPAEAEQTLRRELVRAEASLTDPKALNLRWTDADRQNIADRELSALTYRLLQAALVAQNKPLEALVAAEQGQAQAFRDLLQTQTTAPQAAITLDSIRRVAREQNTTLVRYSILYEEEPRPNGVYSYPAAPPSKATDLLIWVIAPSGEVTFQQVEIETILNTNDLGAWILDVRRSFGASTAASGIAALEERLTSSDQANAQPGSVRTFRQGLNPFLIKTRQLLIDPIQDVLPTDPSATVTFIPQGELFLVPFAALQNRRQTFLIEEHTIALTPSTQALDLIAQRQQQSPQRTNLATVVGRDRPTSADILVVGNPLAMPSVQLDQFSQNRSGQQLSPLPGAELEAAAIAERLGTKALLKEAATEAAVRSQLEQADIIHLATHGIWDDNWGLEGALALALGTGIDDGLLTSREVASLKLRASLVVLSACDTGLGEITGDGVVGLSRAFLAAGADSVVASLWQVPDEPTELLMTNFYDALLIEPNRAAALRQAMLTVQSQYPNPMDWAAFVVIGAASN
ncbi:MAG: CHAT domain-containing protein [Cyanobacteria bacterium P01_H01_bin.121]